MIKSPCRPLRGLRIGTLRGGQGDHTILWIEQNARQEPCRTELSYQGVYDITHMTRWGPQKVLATILHNVPTAQGRCPVGNRKMLLFLPSLLVRCAGKAAGTRASGDGPARRQKLSVRKRVAAQGGGTPRARHSGHHLLMSTVLLGVTQRTLRVAGALYTNTLILTTSCQVFSR